MEERKISIIMPVYNGGIFLKHALDDILKQTYKNFELICIDDGSVDQSQQVLHYYSQVDNRIIVIEQNHKGAGEARNIGMNAASGQYLLFLDADDRYQQNMLEAFVDSIENNESDIVICDAIIFDSVSGVKMDNSWVLRKELLSNTCINPRECGDVLFTFTSGMPWNKFYRKDFVDSSGIQFENIRYWNDTYFTFMLMVQAKKISIVEKQLVAYRVNNSGSITGNGGIYDNPEGGFLVLDNLYSSMVKTGLYQYYKNSFINFALEKYIYIISHINDYNYKVIFEYLSPDFLEKYGVNELQKKDFFNSKYYDYYLHLKEKGGEALLYTIFSDVYKDNEWNYREYYKYKVLFENKSFDDIVSFNDYPQIQTGSRVVLYGAGYRGKCIRSMILQNKDYSLVAWIDKRYEELSKEENQIIGIEGIVGLEYDYIIIAIDAFDTMKEIKRELMEIGVDESKIVW